MTECFLVSYLKLNGKLLYTLFQNGRHFSVLLFTCKLALVPSWGRSGLVVSALVPGKSGPRSSPGRGRCAVFLGKTLTLTVPLSTQVYKWVPEICWENLTNCGGVTCDGLAPRPGGVEILLAASSCRNRGKHRQLWVSHGSKAIFKAVEKLDAHGWSAIRERKREFVKKNPFYKRNQLYAEVK